MIPLAHQGLHILASGQRPAAETAPDAPGFLAALAAGEEGASAPDANTPPSAEACLAAGLVVPVLNPQPSVSAPAAPATETTAAELAAGQLLALPQDAAPTGTASAIADAQPLQPDPLLADGALHPIVPREIPPAAPPALPASLAANPDMVPQSPLQTAEPAASASQAAMLQALHPSQTDASLHDPQPLPTHTRQDHTAAQQSLLTPPLRAQNLGADIPAVPQATMTRVSPAESAWQTRLQHADPLATAAEPTTGAEDADFLDKNLLPPPSFPVPAAHILPSDSSADAAFAPGATAQPPQDQPRDALTAASPTATPPDQTALQRLADPARPQANPIPIPPYPAAQTAPPLSPLATAVPAQLLPHHAAAQTGGVDVLLHPEELGHVKFQIQQHGETVRILLSAERPETLDLLRRHSDQLLQEFRQSGFSQASLDFGHWGQQQRSPPPPAELAALFDTDAREPVAPPRPATPPAATSSGQGLNLRL